MSRGTISLCEAVPTIYPCMYVSIYVYAVQSLGQMCLMAAPLTPLHEPQAAVGLLRVAFSRRVRVNQRLSLVGRVGVHQGLARRQFRTPSATVSPTYPCMYLYLYVYDIRTAITHVRRSTAITHIRPSTAITHIRGQMHTICSCAMQ